MKQIKVLVIDDSAYNRRTITDMLEKSPQIKVVGTGVNGEDGLKKALAIKPDIITLDLEMPRMDGFTFLRFIMSTMPTPVIVVSSRNDDANVFKALELGAIDFLAKPTARISKDLLNIEDDIISKVMMVSEFKMDNLKKRIWDIKPSIHETDKPVEREPTVEKNDYEILAIGASTGGPPALQSIFTSLPKDFPLAVVVSQHMPPGFTKAFAERLNRLCDIEVKEAEKGDPVKKGRVLIAPGGAHMTFKEEGKSIVADISERTSDDLYAPSIDRMFSSVAEKFLDRSIGLVLTGMGNDGKKGVIDIKDKRGYVIAESEESSIVYGMPKEAAKTGKVDKILSLSSIPEEILTMLNLAPK